MPENDRNVNEFRPCGQWCGFRQGSTQLHWVGGDAKQRSDVERAVSCAFGAVFGIVHARIDLIDCVNEVRGGWVQVLGITGGAPGHSGPPTITAEFQGVRELVSEALTQHGLSQCEHRAGSILVPVDANLFDTTPEIVSRLRPE